MTVKKDVERGSKDVRRETQDAKRTLEQTESALNELENSVGACSQANQGLPDGWAKTKLEDITEILDSKRKPVNNKERASRVEGKKESELFPYYGATGKVGYIDDYLFDGEFIALGEDGVPFLDVNKNKAYFLVGKTWVNNHAHVLSEIRGLSLNKVLLHFLNQFDYHGYVNGGTRLKLTQANMRRIPFPLPPLAEQTVIAQTLDTLLAQVDNIKTRLDAIPNILKTFRQSVLAAAVSGKLTEEWRGENECEAAESYSMALNAVRVEKHNELQILANRKSKYKNALEPIDNVITHTPINWKVFSLDEVTCRITYGLTVRPAYVDEGVPIISAKEIKTGLVDYHGAKKFDDSLFEAQREKCKIFMNDVLFSKTGSIGHVARVTDDRPLCSSQNIAVLSPLINSKYLELVMRSPYIQELASGSVKANAIPDLQLGVMARFPIPCPFELEQTEIVRRVEELFAFADQIEQQVKNAQGRVNNLTQSILAKAFRGELTAQWRAQNPDLITGENSAEALLAKIQEERDALKKSSKPKKKSTAKKTTRKKADD